MAETYQKRGTCSGTDTTHPFARNSQSPERCESLEHTFWYLVAVMINKLAADLAGLMLERPGNFHTQVTKEVRNQL